MNVSITLPLQGDHNIQYNHVHDLFSPCSLSLFKPRPVCTQYIDKVDFKGIIYCHLSLSVAAALSTSMLSSLTVTLISLMVVVTINIFIGVAQFLGIIYCMYGMKISHYIQHETGLL